MRLSDFISSHKEPVLQAWEDFARSISPLAATKDVAELRDHASLMLDVIVADLEAPQSSEQQARKSRGGGPHTPGESYAEIHAAGRLDSGYTISQLVAEYRALRASVLQLWAAQRTELSAADFEDMTRFNEAIDQALSESVARFAAKTAETAENEQRRLQAVLDAAPVGICLVDQDGKVLLANAANRQIWGEHPQAHSVDAYGPWKGWWADGSGRSGQPLGRSEWAIARALGGDEVEADTVAIEPFGLPGARRTVLQRSKSTRNVNGLVTGAVLAQIDVTDQVSTGAALRESEAKFRTIANAMPQMVWSTRPDGFHDYYNDQWYRFTGVEPQSTDGINAWNEMFHPEDQQRAWTAWRHSLATGDTYEIQYRLRHFTGEYRWTLGRALPVRDDDGRITRWMGTCTDIHDQKLAEDELKRQSERKDEFLAMLAHELRNPLAPISTAAQLLKLPGGDQARVGQLSDVISRQVSHMTNLVDDLLDVSRVTRGLVELTMEPVDMKLVLNHAIEQVRPLIEARQHDLQLRVASAAAHAQGDKTRLVQVVANLLNNAAKYTPHGGLISVSLAVKEHTVRIEVTDTGTGIAPTLLPYIFDLFAQGERSPDRAQGGLGLGLSLVKQLTALHGGEITASSQGLGKGSTFALVLPLAASQQEQAAIDEPKAARGEQGHARNVMIVDDNADAAWGLAALLGVDGHVVSVLGDAASALSSPRREHIDAFVLDIGLPEMDGYELARRLRADGASAGALMIALTGYGQAHDRVLARIAGFDHHLVKPVDIRLLKELLAKGR
jgi:PAS domain S-box-containing protein